MRLLVCGGRDFENKEGLRAVLKGKDITCLISGGAKGADYLAEQYAIDEGIETDIYPANWKKHRRSAGPIRNRQMIEEGKPDEAIAFPGGRGTEDMIRQLKKAGIPCTVIPRLIK
jgi:hypothetical protein